ncbi:MAG: hypothetical protein KGJ73_06010, partial [Rhodospirillales bacterium]|nr:hypothetical protein [Rhodospirillales bacterium]
MANHSPKKRNPELIKIANTIPKGNNLYEVEMSMSRDSAIKLNISVTVETDQEVEVPEKVYTELYNLF